MASLDEDKVMDVSKPGRGKIITTSRPVIVSPSSAVADQDVSPVTPDKEVEQPLAPSAAHKVIQPLNPVQEDENTEVPDEKPADEPKPAETSDAAGVDELAKAAESKKLEAKQAEEQAKKDEELQKLIASKKYFVPTGHSSVSGGRNWLMILIVSLLALLIAAYVLIDARVIKTDVKLPFEFIKEDEPADESTSTQTTQTQTQQSDADEESTELSQSAAQLRADDTDRKNELKNLQLRLETYFNDNETYPMTLDGLDPAPTVEESTGPSGDVYTYTSDGQTYTLSATLANKADRDAVDGVFTLKSVN